jgi:hypothetical protein
MPGLVRRSNGDIGMLSLRKAVQTSAARAGKPYSDRFAFLMATMAMKYADIATISRPTANAIPSINTTIFPFTHRAMDTL